VEAVIREHGFEPSKSARAMRTNSARLIGIIVSRLDSASENRSVRGMLEVLYARGYDAMLMESEFDPAKIDEHLALLARRGVDGVILFAFSSLDLERLRPWQDKLILMARDWPQISSVCYDDQGAILQILTRLYAAGKRQIDFIGVDPSDATTGALRLQAYQQFCADHQLPCRYLTGTLDVQSGYDLTAKLLTPATDAVVCAVYDEEADKENFEKELKHFNEAAEKPMLVFKKENDKYFWKEEGDEDFKTMEKIDHESEELPKKTQ
jgi:LacI family trehalose operon transcriptional repressor